MAGFHRVEAHRVDPGVLEEIWPQVSAALSWGSSRSPATPALYAAVKIGRSALIIAPDYRFPTRLSSVIVASVIRQARQEPTLLIRLLAGRHIGTWIESAARTLGSYASACGCTHIHVIGRRGWMPYRHRFGMSVTWASESADADHNHYRYPEFHQY